MNDIGALVEAIRDSGKGVLAFESLLSEIAVALRDVLAQVEQPRENIAQAITSGLAGLSITAPDVNVTVAAAPPAEVTVNVPPAQVVVQPQNATPVGWALRITQRDDLGNIVAVSLKPDA